MSDAEYRNGPLPESLASQAYVTDSGHEFALHANAAIEYLQWAQTSGLKVHGFEVWQPTSPGPTPLVGIGCEGDAEMCIQAIPTITEAHGEFVVFNILATRPGLD